MEAQLRRKLDVAEDELVDKRARLEEALVGAYRAILWGPKQ